MLRNVWEGVHNTLRFYNMHPLPAHCGPMMQQTMIYPTSQSRKRNIIANTTRCRPICRLLRLTATLFLAGGRHH
jgi:hypothetical protein